MRTLLCLALHTSITTACSDDAATSQDSRDCLEHVTSEEVGGSTERLVEAQEP
jgi:hypothetical protein